LPTSLVRVVPKRERRDLEDAMNPKLHCRSLVAAGLCCAAAASSREPSPWVKKANIDGVITAALTTNTDVKTKRP
jgi:hypothetical protein